LLTRFLLGETTERERAEVEDRLLSDEEFYEQMLAAEGDLTDAYVRGELQAGERERFEKSFFTSTRRRERVEFARGLAESATLLYETQSATASANERAPSDASLRRGFLTSLLSARPALRYALAAAAVALVAIAVWLAFERTRARVEPQQARTGGVAPRRPEKQTQGSAQNNGRADTPQQQVAAPTPQQGSASTTPDAAPTPELAAAPKVQAARPRPVLATITLAPGSLRDGEAIGDLFIPRAATHLRVRLQLEQDAYRSYRAIVSTPEGRRVWTGVARKDSATNANSVTLTLPAASLKRGDYVVELSGVAGGRPEPAAAYSFRVTRED
jgi:hypothetical protein